MLNSIDAKWWLIVAGTIKEMVANLQGRRQYKWHEKFQILRLKISNFFYFI